jgi:hypothetical protein
MRVYPGTALYDRAVAEGVVSPQEDLLEPFHYIAPGMTAESIQRRLRDHVRECPNWIVGEPPPVFHQFAERLRQRGVLGPIWTYFAMLQRMAPAFPVPAQP